MKNSTVSLSNVYGVPFFVPAIDKLAEKLNAEVVFGVTNLREHKPSKDFTIVLAGLPFLVSAGIPVLGYRFTGGKYVRTTLPTTLEPNSCKVYIPKYRHPNSDELRAFYESGGDPETVKDHKRFILRLTADLDHRVFGRKSQAKISAKNQGAK